MDLTILPQPAMDPLLKQGKIVANTVAVFARSSVSIAVRTGAPKPDISTVEAMNNPAASCGVSNTQPKKRFVASHGKLIPKRFKRAMLAAKSVSYADPAKGGGSGIHFANVLQRLGIAEEMKPKTKLVLGDESVQLVAKGEAEIAAANTPAFFGAPGVDLVGPLPAQLQNPTDFVFVVGVGTSAQEPEAARALIQYLLAPDAGRVIKAKGLEPR